VLETMAALPVEEAVSVIVLETVALLEGDTQEREGLVVLHEGGRRGKPPVS
jgi:hypothetical protein